MVKDYAEKFYVPATIRGASLEAEGLKRSVALARAKDRLRHLWGGIKIVGVHTSVNGNFKVGDMVQVEALVDLPDLDPKEVAVELLHRPGQRQRPTRTRHGYAHGLLQGNGPRSPRFHWPYFLPLQRPPRLRRARPPRQPGFGDAL